LIGVTTERVLFKAKIILSPTSFFLFAFFSNFCGEGFL
jgi:hypothetical protein